MLTRVEPASARQSGGSESSIEVLSVATAVPPYKVGQDEVAYRAQTVFPQFARLDALYTNTGIETRYSCNPSDWYHETRTWEQRTASFQHHALLLLETV